MSKQESGAARARRERVEAINTMTLTLRNDAARDRSGRPLLYFITRSVAASGMSRVFSCYWVERGTGELHGLDWLICTAIGYSPSADGFRVGGGGMDMRFAVADDIARACELGNGNDIAFRSL